MLYHREVKEYWHAKREAARRQGTPHLPSNAEVHEQLRSIARKVDGDNHLKKLAAMRNYALGVMELLEPHFPRLIGSVLSGHIRRGSDIDLHVHTDDVDGLCDTLERAGYSVVVEVVRARKNGELMDFTHVRLLPTPTGGDVDGVEVEITVCPPASLHVRPRSGITGKAMERASVAEVRRIIAESEPLVRAVTPPLLRAPISEDAMTKLVPELLACRGVTQNNYHHLDVYEHICAVVAGLEQMVKSGFERLGRHAENLQRHLASEGDQTLLFLAGVCHDLGKPATQTFSRDGRIRFFGHDRLGAEMVREIGPRIGLDATAVDDLSHLTDCHLEAVRIPTEAGEPSRIRRMIATVGDRLPELALLSLADVEAARGPAQSEARIDEHALFVSFLLDQYFDGGFLINPTLPVTEDDLLEQFGTLERRTVSRMLDALLDAFVDGEFEGREEGLVVASEMLSEARWGR